MSRPLLRSKSNVTKVLPPPCPFHEMWGGHRDRSLGAHTEHVQWNHSIKSKQFFFTVGLMSAE